MTFCHQQFCLLIYKYINIFLRVKLAETHAYLIQFLCMWLFEVLTHSSSSLYKKTENWLWGISVLDVINWYFLSGQRGKRAWRSQDAFHPHTGIHMAASLQTFLFPWQLLQPQREEVVGGRGRWEEDGVGTFDKDIYWIVICEQLTAYQGKL